MKESEMSKRGNVKGEGSGRVSAWVSDIVNSKKIRKQIEAVQALQAMTTPSETPPRKAMSDKMPRPCACHPDDNPPVPCPQKFAYSECMRAALDAKAKECEEMRKDAERYRHWRKHTAIIVPSVTEEVIDNGLDAAIDAARKEGGK